MLVSQMLKIKRSPFLTAGRCNLTYFPETSSKLLSFEDTLVGKTILVSMIHFNRVGISVERIPGNNPLAGVGGTHSRAKPRLSVSGVLFPKGCE